VKKLIGIVFLFLLTIAGFAQDSAAILSRLGIKGATPVGGLTNYYKFLPYLGTNGYLSDTFFSTNGTILGGALTNITVDTNLDFTRVFPHIGRVSVTNTSPLFNLSQNNAINLTNFGSFSASNITVYGLLIADTAVFRVSTNETFMVSNMVAGFIRATNSLDGPLNTTNLVGLVQTANMPWAELQLTNNTKYLQFSDTNNLVNFIVFASGTNALASGSQSISGTNLAGVIQDLNIPWVSLQGTNDNRYLQISGTNSLASALSMTNLVGGATNTIVTGAQPISGTNLVGNLQIANFNGGSGASGSTYWSGNGTWATPVAGIPDPVGLSSNNFMTGVSNTFNGRVNVLGTNVCYAITLGGVTATAWPTGGIPDPAGLHSNNTFTVMNTFQSGVTIGGGIISNNILTNFNRGYFEDNLHALRMFATNTGYTSSFYNLDVPGTLKVNYLNATNALTTVYLTTPLITMTPTNFSAYDTGYIEWWRKDLRAVWRFGNDLNYGNVQKISLYNVVTGDTPFLVASNGLTTLSALNVTGTSTFASITLNSSNITSWLQLTSGLASSQTITNLYVPGTGTFDNIIVRNITQTNLNYHFTNVLANTVTATNGLFGPLNTTNLVGLIQVTNMPWAAMQSTNDSRYLLITGTNSLASALSLTNLVGSATNAIANGSQSIQATNFTGSLRIVNFNGGTAAGPTTYWRGDGTWVTPVGGIPDPVGLSSNNLFTGINTFIGSVTFVDGLTMTNSPTIVSGAVSGFVLGCINANGTSAWLPLGVTNIISSDGSVGISIANKIADLSATNVSTINVGAGIVQASTVPMLLKGNGGISFYPVTGNSNLVAGAFGPDGAFSVNTNGIYMSGAIGITPLVWGSTNAVAGNWRFTRIVQGTSTNLVKQYNNGSTWLTNIIWNPAGDMIGNGTGSITNFASAYFSSNSLWVGGNALPVQLYQTWTPALTNTFAFQSNAFIKATLIVPATGGANATNCFDSSGRVVTGDISLRITATNNTTLVFTEAWKWFGSAAPASITNGGQLLISARCDGTTTGSVAAVSSPMQ